MSVSYAIALVYEEKVVQRVYIWTILGTSGRRMQCHQIEALKLANADLHGLVFPCMQLYYNTFMQCCYMDGTPSLYIST